MATLLPTFVCKLDGLDKIKFEFNGITIYVSKDKLFKFLMENFKDDRSVE